MHLRRVHIIKYKVGVELGILDKMKKDQAQHERVFEDVYFDTRVKMRKDFEDIRRSNGKGGDWGALET